MQEAGDGGFRKLAGFRDLVVWGGLLDMNARAEAPRAVISRVRISGSGQLYL